MGLRAELRTLLRLAGPLALGEFVTMLGGGVTTMMLGRLSAEAVGIQGLGAILFFSLMIFGLDLMLGLDYPVAYAVGAGRPAEAGAFLVQGCWLALALAGVLSGALRYGVPLLIIHLDLNPVVAGPVSAYLHILMLGVPPLLLWVACRRYLQGRGMTRAVLVALLTAFALEVSCKWVLIFGRLGIPALGVNGSAWGAVIEFYWLGGAGAALVWWSRPRTSSRWSFRPDPERMRQIVRLGAPAATRAMAEVGVFAAATTLAARLDTTSLAAHQLVMSAASLAFMIPLGLGAGTAVRVGNALGARDSRAARQAGWAGIASAAVVMAGTGLVFLLAPRLVLRAYTTDQAVIEAGVPLIYCAAAFQLFDGVQAVATGALRGSGDTRTPLLVNLVAHWGLALPLGWALCFRWHYGIVGLWLGLALGLMIVGVVLIAVWARRARRLSAYTPIM